LSIAAERFTETAEVDERGKGLETNTLTKTTAETSQGSGSISRLRLWTLEDKCNVFDNKWNITPAWHSGTIPPNPHLSYSPLLYIHNTYLP